MLARCGEEMSLSQSENASGFSCQIAVARRTKHPFTHSQAFQIDKTTRRRNRAQLLIRVCYRSPKLSQNNIRIDLARHSRGDQILHATIIDTHLGRSGGEGGDDASEGKADSSGLHGWIGVGIRANLADTMAENAKMVAIVQKGGRQKHASVARTSTFKDRGTDEGQTFKNGGLDGGGARL